MGQPLHTFVPMDGVVCGRRGHRRGRVKALYLENLSIVVSISSSVANLTFLGKLHLPSNHLQGVIPRELAALSYLVANMASYAISLSLILVIHDNMINGTNYIVYHVFVDISRSQGCQNTTCQIEKIVYFAKVKNKKEKKKKGHHRMNRRYLDSKCRCNRRTSWYTG
jgi:hypothetical protein